MTRVMSYIIAILVSLTAILTSCESNGRFYEENGAVWNTTYHIKYRADRQLNDSIMAVMNRIESSLSPFTPNSLISKVNDNRSMAVDSDIVKVMAISQSVNRASNRAFDPTVSPLINLWGFGYKGHDVNIPTDSDIAMALTYVGIDSCHITPEMTMHKKSAETTFNFSAVTKGYACDEIGRMLRRNGSTDYMIEIGGELTLSGINDRGTPWRVMIDAPIDTVAGHTRLATIETSDCSIATSGNYRNFKDTPTGRIGHTINPVTGHPVITTTLSATVIAADCATADALATACMAMPADSALAMIQNYPSAHAMLVTSLAGSMTIITTPAFPYQP